jgi:hypothetical protein
MSDIAYTIRKRRWKVGVKVLTKEQHPVANTNTFHFLKKNVLSVTDISRSKRLSEILDRFSNGISDEVFVIQNAKKKDAQAVIVDIDYFEQLLQMKEVIDEALDQIAMEDAYARKNKPANQTLSDIFDEDDINVNELMMLLEED